MFRTSFCYDEVPNKYDLFDYDAYNMDAGKNPKELKQVYEIGRSVATKRLEDIRNYLKKE